MMRHGWLLGAVILVSLTSTAAENEPPLEKVFQDLGVIVNPQDEIIVTEAAQGLFYKTEKWVEVVPVAKYSFDKQEKVSEVRAGYYFPSAKLKPIPLWIIGPEAGDRNCITGLPAVPRGPYFFDPGKNPFGFFVQSANFNPDFSDKGETVCSQDSLNYRISRFGNDIHKLHIYPYKTQREDHSDWFILCWEFSTNNDNQDIMFVVRGVKLLGVEKKKVQSVPENQLNQTITLLNR